MAYTTQAKPAPDASELLCAKLKSESECAKLKSESARSKLSLRWVLMATAPRHTKPT